MEIATFKEMMCFYGSKMGLLFNDKQLNMFYYYMILLLEWNSKVNLTAITKPDEVILKHFIDSLSINKYIGENMSLADIGTGAGFPGIPLKIYRKDLRITLVDSLNKRINFLDEVISTLQLKDIVTVHSRVEDFGKDKVFRESFDFATARAVANLSVLSEFLLPVVRIGGKCVCMKGNDVQREVEEAKIAVDILGGKVDLIDEFVLPDSDIGRSVVVIDKIKNTLSKYPRKAGIPAKEPLR